MQWIAMFTMLIDHIGAIFYTDQLIFRLIGRLAFPIYVYLAVLGYNRTSNIKLYMLRLIALAFVSQLPFQLAFDTNHINVIGTLAISVLVMKCIDLYKRNYILVALFVVIASVVLEYFNFDYGAYGLLLMLIYRYLINKRAVALLTHFALELLFIVTAQWSIQFFSIIVTLLIVYKESFVHKLDRLRAPNWIWRLFYPLHLTLLYIIVRFVLEK